MGIKLKHGARNQLCSFGGAAAKGLTKETLMDIGNKVVQELKDGALKEEKQVARERADALIAEEKKTSPSQSHQTNRKDSTRATPG